MTGAAGVQQHLFHRLRAVRKASAHRRRHGERPPYNGQTVVVRGLEQRQRSAREALDLVG